MNQCSHFGESNDSEATNNENLEDYETQLFGFTPKSFVSGIYNAVSEYFMEALEIFREYFEKEFFNEMTANEVAEKMNVVRKHLVTQIDNAFDTLETYLGSNIFCIPSNIVLPEDLVQMESPVSQDDYTSLQAAIQHMKNKILAIKLANATLKQRIQVTQDIQQTFDTILERLHGAQAAARQEGVVDLRDSLSHCASRVLDTIRTLNNTRALLQQI